jgi:putative N-acetylmannosamine-6-phosphate epimerase
MKITEKEFNVLTGEETITERDETAAEKKARELLEKEAAIMAAEATKRRRNCQSSSRRLVRSH